MGGSGQMPCRQCGAYFLIVICFLAQVRDLQARPIPMSGGALKHQLHRRGLKFQVEEPTILSYHNGPILSGTTYVPVYLVWYGNFSDSQRSIVLDFFTSSQASSPSPPSVVSWWQITAGYKDASGTGVPQTLSVQAQVSDDECSKGKNLSVTDLETLVTSNLNTFPTNANSVYLVLTADDVEVEDFCSENCASHYSTDPTTVTQNQQLPYGWVGNPASQCAGKCSWPFAQTEYGPTSSPLLPPNGDIGMDGMIINMASILAGMATNPFDTGFYQGDGAAPLEAATACTGIFGPGAYAGYAGNLLLDKATGVSFNAYGTNNRMYLLPALWDPMSANCTTPT